MLKSYYYILALTIVLIGSFSSYAQEKDFPQQSELKYRAHLIKKIYSIGTASINGTYYPLGNAIARLVGKYINNIVLIAEPTAGSVANIEYLRNNRIDFALVQSDVAWTAFQGTSEYAGNKFDKLRVLSSLYSEKIQIVVRSDSGINKLEDLKGKKISVGDRESGSAAGVVPILEVAGLKHNVDYELVYERFTKSTESLVDGYIDAVYYVGAVPSDGISRVAKKIPIKLIEIPTEVISKLTTKYPYYCSEKIKANSYQGVTSDLNTLGFRALLACTDKIQEKEAYNILKTIYSNPKIVSEQNEILVELDIKTARDAVDPLMLHLGAIKFFNQEDNK